MTVCHIPSTKRTSTKGGQVIGGKKGTGELLTPRRLIRERAERVAAYYNAPFAAKYPLLASGRENLISRSRAEQFLVCFERQGRAPHGISLCQETLAVRDRWLSGRRWERKSQ